MLRQSTKPKVRYKNLRRLGYENYLIGDNGTPWTRWTRRGCTGKWRKLKVHLDCNGRQYVTLYDGKEARKGQKFQVHKLVLLAFVGPPPDGMDQVRHFPDPDPTNNNLSNLQWGTQAENEADKVVHGTSNHGSRNGAAKLTEDDVRTIRRLYKTGRYMQKDLAKMYGLKQPSMSDIIRRVNWYWLED